MIKAILWDIDGTLLNFEKAQVASMHNCFKRYELGPLSEQMLEDYERINSSYWAMLEKGQIEKKELLVRRFVDFFRLYGIDEALAESFNHDYLSGLADTIVLNDGAIETMSALKGKVIQACATNGVKFVQDRKLVNSGLDQLFDHVFISEVVGYEKPDKRFFDEVFKVLGEYRGDEVLFVGDSLAGDIGGANNAGIISVFFNPFHKVKDLGVKVDYEIEKLEEVLKIVDAFSSK